MTAQNLDPQQDQDDDKRKPSAAEGVIRALSDDTPTLFQTEEGLSSTAPGNKFFENGAARAATNKAGANHFRPHASVDLSGLLGKASSTESMKETLTKLTGHEPTMSEINNARGFLDMTSYSEGTLGRGGNNGYGMIVGDAHGSKFIDDYSHHPHVMVTVRPGLNSTAAGRYQFLGRTWDSLQSKMNLPDFGAASQDAGALQLAKDSGAMNDILSGNFQGAIHKSRGIWASFPGAGYGQGEQNMATLVNVAEKSVAKYQNEPATPVAGNDLTHRGALPEYTSDRVVKGQEAVNALPKASVNDLKSAVAESDITLEPKGKTKEEEKLGGVATGNKPSITERMARAGAPSPLLSPKPGADMFGGLGG